VTPWGSKRINTQKEVDEIVKSFKTNVYAEGFIEGVRYARNQVVEFLNAHHDLGDILTIEEIISELEYWKIKDKNLRGLADGEMAPIYGMDQCEEVCQDCFGADLCLVCERATR
jgi:hypothetical protein